MEPSSSSKSLFTLPDNYYFLSLRRSQASSFVSWVCISLIVLSLLLLSNSFNFRVVTPFFQSFNAFVGSDSDRFVDNSSVISSSVNKDGSLNVGVVLERKPQLGDFVNRSFEETPQTHEGISKTQLVNFVEDGDNRKAYDGKCGELNNCSGIEGGLGFLKRNGGISELEKCDLFDGKWVKDESKPYYAGGSCPYIDMDFDCHRNGRPDGGFVKWRWKPNGCDIPRLNATDFLERLRGKKLVFVGDSLNRNMWESLVCILWQSIDNKTRVYETSGKSEFKKMGFYAFQFEDYNCSVDFVGSPFLVRESSLLRKKESIDTLRIDLMDQTTSMYHDADVIIFNTGHWWTHEKTSRGEDYYQEGDHLHRRLKVLEAYKRALRTWARWVDKNVDSNKTQVLFRGYSVTHFRGGQWNSGGQCHKETEPIYNTAYLQKYPSKMRALEHILQEMTIPVIYLNISRLTAYRKDGHPSIFRTDHKIEEKHLAAKHSQDCSHWCLPGVPDTWNELLYASLLKAGRGSWRV